MPPRVQFQLDWMIHRLTIDCVIISTEPVAHKAYGLWAMEQGLNVIMDKPITARKHACTSITAAKGIAEDYEELQNAYDELQSRKQTCFLIQCHRRYHPLYDFVTDKIRQIQTLAGCPITSISSSHCDGNWRMPKEIVEQDYHTFKDGYGKISHSGYHLLDICSHFMMASWGPDMTGPKVPDRLEVISSFTTVSGFYDALNDDDYKRVFGQEYSASHSYTEKDFTKLMDGMGEYDCAILMTAYRGVHSICLVQLNLLHAGFSRRSSVEIGPDLYRGVGRVKHESHDIKCGPF
ncbi:hypothetical protein PENANT_c028G08921 [Penicillium antarcticum]|uniref:Gfo/Idh/MocA-like oxidoreductase N-terminal domain-containing protein n=1 Tax=Penicillium antarcticum TaxID=416450 RepID=A0A1V6PWG6_9EURO|nr:hypothetical protein PENANT_c028G08921 [Penicillium antarcticum]